MMVFWIFILICDLLIPCIMVGFGSYFSKKAPKKMNKTFGYRTSMSMKNRETWEFAHKHIGTLWFWLGLIILIPSVALLLFVFGKEVETVGMVGMIICLVQIVVLIGSVVPTEIALKKAFDSNGKRWQKRGSP